jgi:hypothetical protein
MVDEPILDLNDQALIAHFLRGMTRFEKFVRAQGKTDVTERIEWAYSEALVEFVERQRRQ